MIVAFLGSWAVLGADVAAQELDPVPICFPAGKSPASIKIGEPGSERDLTLECIRATFTRLASGDGYEIAIDLVFDGQALPSYMDSVLRKNMPSSSCNDRHEVKAVEVNPAAGNLSIRGFLGFQKWACASWDFPCCSGLDCRMCRQQVTTRLFEVSPFYSGTVTAAVTGLDECRAKPSDAMQSLVVSSNGSVSSGLSRDQEFLVTAIGTLIGGVIFGPVGAVGGALIVGDFLKQANSVGFNSELTFPFESNTGTASGGDVTLCATGAQFVQDPELGKLTAVVRRSGRKPRSVARRVHSVLKQQKKLAESDAKGELTTTVGKGEGWWHLASRHYGDGRYFLALVGANPQIPARTLYPGEQITIPTLRSLIENPRTVRAGDSLWTIAERVFGDGSRWQELFDERITSNPDLIFPAAPTKKR